MAISFSSKHLLVIMRQVPVLCFGFLICQTRITKLSCLKIKYSDSCKLFSKHKLVIISFKYVIAMPFLAKNVQFSSVTQSYLTLCDPMNCSMPGSPVHHQLPELSQTHIHRVSDAIQPSHPLSSPSPPAFNLSQNQGLFQ